MMLSLEGSQIVTMLTPMPTVRFTMPISQHHSKAKSQVTCDYQGLLTAYAHLKKRQANKLASLQPHWSAAENSKEESKQQAILKTIKVETGAKLQNLKQSYA